MNVRQILLGIGLAAGMISPALAHYDGANAAGLHAWFETLTNQNDGYCCAESDGFVIDASSISVSKSGLVWHSSAGDVNFPLSAVVKQPNLSHLTILWPINNADPAEGVRCIIFGALG